MFACCLQLKPCAVITAQSVTGGEENTKEHRRAMIIWRREDRISSASAMTGLEVQQKIIIILIHNNN